MMSTGKRAVSWLLALAVLIGLMPAVTPAAEAQDTSTGSGGNVTVTQTAAWDSSVPGNTVAKVTLKVTSRMELQAPKDVVFLIDRAASQPLDIWKQQAIELAGMLSIVPGMRYALVSYGSTAEKLLDFTTDISQFRDAVNAVTLGANCNAYAGLQEAKRLIDSRGASSQQACVVLLSSGRFNMNLVQTQFLGQELKRTVPVYGTRDGSVEWKKEVCSGLADTGGIAMAIGESKILTNVTVTGRLDTDNFIPGPGVAADGTFTTVLPTYQMGETKTLTFSGQLKDRQQTGDIPVAGAASFAGGGVSVSAAAVGLSRSGLTVTYDANGGAGTVPRDSGVYMAGDTVAVKPSNLQKEGWNFSGWTRDGNDLQNGQFTITGDTELKGSWGRAFVKLGSSTIGSNIKGKRMLSRADIWKKYPDRAFYKNNYWLNLSSIYLHDFVDTTGCEMSWDITDTSVPGNEPGAVIAWVTENSYNKYDLHIGGRGGLEAPQDCESLFVGESVISNSRFEHIYGLNILDTSNVTNMDRMFEYCSRLLELDLSNFDTSNVKSMYGIFHDCSRLISLDLSHLNTSNVTNMWNMFRGCKGLTSLDISPLDTSNVTNMAGMFGEMNLEELDLSDFDTRAVTDMSYMFWKCSKLRTLTFSSDKFVTSGVTEMNRMFYGCSALTSLDLRAFDTSSLTDASCMFEDCTALTTLDISTFTTPNLQFMIQMFANCRSLTTLEGVSNFDTSDVRDMSGAFRGCTALTELDLSGWDMRRVGEPRQSVYSSYSLDSMFEGCTNLRTITRTEIEVAAGCTAYDFCKDAPELQKQNIQIYALNESGGRDPIDTGSKPAATSYAASSYASEQFPSEPDKDLLTDSTVQYAAPDDSPTDSTGRPVYANSKAGLWDCGEVEPGQQIDYSLELQYLPDDVSTGGTSGVLTVTNPLPEGLIYNEDAQISGPQRIVTGDGGSAAGTVLQSPAVEDGVLTFTVTGLSVGAKYVVTYSCTAPAEAPESYTEFLNTASVDDSGLIDNADPVRHYMNEQPELYTVDYQYAQGSPAGAPVYPAQECAAGTVITLPEPSMPGYDFVGWKMEDGTPVPGSYIVNGNTTFTGSWTQITQPTVNVSYSFAGDLPENADLILEMLLDGVPEEYPANTTVAAPTLAVLPDGYAFRWLEPVGEDGTFHVGTEESVSIVGQWTKQAYTVTYQYENAPADAPALPAPEQHVWGTRVSQAAEPAGTADHLFLGWTGVETDENGTFEMPMEDVTVTGSWADRPAVQEVLIDPNGGTWNGSDAQAVLPLSEYEDQVAAGTFPDAVKEGADFLGWVESVDAAGDFAKVLTASWPDAPTEYTVAFDSQGGTPVVGQTVNAGSRAVRPADPVREGFQFLGWYRDQAGTLAWDFDTDVVTEDLTLYAKWEAVPAGSTTAHTPSVRRYTITATANEGGSITPAGKIGVSEGSSKTFLIVPAGGWTIQDVWVDGESAGAVSSYEFEKIHADHTIEAFFAEEQSDTTPSIQDHITYLNGFPDGTFRPEACMTRGEAAQMFFNLLGNQPASAPAAFCDVRPGMWYEDAINALNVLGVMAGVGGGRFLPEQIITRAEFTAAVVRFSGESAAAEAQFTDVHQGDWSYGYIAAAAGLDWITGYPDGTFRPDDAISRAEAAAIVGRMLGRSADRSYVDSHAAELRQFPDVPPDLWAYYDILEAANAHDFFLDEENGETWVRVNGRGSRS